MRDHPYSSNKKRSKHRTVRTSQEDQDDTKMTEDPQRTLANLLRKSTKFSWTSIQDCSITNRVEVAYSSRTAPYWIVETKPSFIQHCSSRERRGRMGYVVPSIYISISFHMSPMESQDCCSKQRQERMWCNQIDTSVSFHVMARRKAMYKRSLEVEARKYILRQCSVLNMHEKLYMGR